MVVFAFEGLSLNSIMALYPMEHKFFSWHQFITYMFAHANFSHILLNMIILWSFGPRLENKLGSDNFLNFYLFSGILGGVSHILLYNAPVIGASASIWAILAVYTAVYPNQKLYLWFIIPIQSVFIIAPLFLYEIISIFSDDGVSHIGHVIGALSGLLFYFLFLFFDKNKKVPN